MRRRVVWAVFAVVAVACGGGGSSAPDASLFDAPPPPDAAIVACTADHAESDEPNNDLARGGAAEPTGLVVATGPDPVTLCGQIDPAQVEGTVADADFYQFEVTEDLRLRAELRAAEGATLQDFELALWLTNDSGTAVALLTRGAFRGDHGVVELGTLSAGLYALSVSAGTPEPAAPVLYDLAVLEDPDDCSGAPTDTYVEANDGGGSRGNDAVAVEFTPVAQFSATDGTPEPTALAIAPAAIAELLGESSDVASSGDDYQDRDSFEVATDAAATELELRLSWTDPSADLDLFVFEVGPGAELSLGAGSQVGATGQEAVTLAVPPGQAVWLWVGGSGGIPSAGTDYELTVCGGQLLP